MTAEADMWAAAVEQAFRAGCRSEIPGRKADLGGASALDAANDWRFLTAHYGPWSESRKNVCDACGIDPEIVRREALRRGPSRHALFGLRAEMAREEKAARRAEPKPKRERKPKPAPKVSLRPRMAKDDRAALCRAVAEAWAAGVSREDITARFGVSGNTAAKIARAAGAKRPIWFMRQSSAKASASARARNAERNAEIMRLYAAGENYAAIGRAVGMKWSAVRYIVKAASNASGEVLGGACVAGGGGGVGGASFHARSMQSGKGA